MSILFKTPNLLLQDWLDNRCPDYLAALFRHHSAPTSTECEECLLPSLSLYSCLECLGNRRLCQACLLQTHRFTPTHQTSHWHGTFWEPTSLLELGLILCLGHSGQKCPSQHTRSQLQVGDISGFSTVNVMYCICDLRDGPAKAIQLLHVGLFPCSDIVPQSAFTLSLLNHFNLCVP